MPEVRFGSVRSAMWNTLAAAAWLLLLALTITADAEADVNAPLLATVRSYMNLEQPPCERFYEYACGNWAKAQGANASYVDVISSLEQRANSELAALIEQPQSPVIPESQALYAKVRVYYETCRQHSESAKQQPERYLELIKPAHNVPWPETSSNSVANLTHFRWPHTLGRLRAVGLNNVLLNEQLLHLNATSYMLQLSRPSGAQAASWDKWELQQLAALQPPELAARLKQLQHKLTQLWQNSDGAAAFELTLGELQRRLPAFQPADYFTQLYGAALPDTTPILVRHLSYLRRLSELLSRTPADTLLHYLRLRLLSYLRREQPLSSSKNHCIQHQRALMSLALDYIYERERYRHVRPESDAVIGGVFARMQRQFLRSLERHTDELSAEELEFLRQKIERMQLNIGNLPKDVPERYYGDYYDALDVASGYFHWNHLNALQLKVAREQQLLQLPAAAAEHSFVVWPHGSPAYHQKTNRLLIPYAYLQLPIFHRRLHELFLYAELGNTLGHEIMHGFDTVGLQYDADGSPSLLLMDAVQKQPHFLNAMRCLSREPTANLNEKLADFSGLRLAYEAHFERADAVPQFRFAGQNGGLSDGQLFFVKFAQFFCAISPQHVTYDSSHDTPFQRVPQALANHPAFAREFNCGARSPMNSPQRCNVW